MRAISILLGLAHFNAVSAWGRDGHSTIAAVAQTLLTPEALKGALGLLNQDDPPATNLANISSWADEVVHTSEFKWSAPLHFTNVQDSSPACITSSGYGNCTFNYTRDCVDREGKNIGFCNAGAIANYSSHLSKGITAGLTDTATIQALKFLVHFVGDIHQPLHCGMASDRGGVKINVDYPVKGQSSHYNLHNVWDFGLIVNHEGLEGEWAPLAKSLEDQLSSTWTHDKQSWLEVTDPKAWVQDSLNQATKYAYRFANGTEIRSEDREEIVLGNSLQPYMERGGVIEMQLAKGGVRLATLLNALWSGSEAA